MRQISFLIICFVLVFTALPAAAQDTALITGFNISDNEGTSDRQIAMFDGAGVLHVVWEDRTADIGGDLFYRTRLTDGTWTETLNLTENFVLLFTESARLHLRADGTACLLFMGNPTNTSNSETGAYHTCDIPARQFSLLISTGVSNAREYIPAFSTDNLLHTIHNVDAGTLVFDDTQAVLNNETFLATDPQFLIDSNGSYHVLFVRQGRPFSVEHLYSTDGGLNWTQSRLSDDNFLAGGSNVGPADMAADNLGNVHAVWYSAEGVQYRKFSGGTWSAPSTLAIFTLGSQLTSSSTTLSVAAGPDGLAHVAWQGSSLLYTRHLADGQWSRLYKLKEEFNSGRGPELLIDRTSQAHILWSPEDTRFDVYHASFDPALFVQPAALVAPSETGREFSEQRTLLFPSAAIVGEPDGGAIPVGSLSDSTPVEVTGSDPTGLWLRIVRPFSDEPAWLPAYLTASTAAAGSASSIMVTVPSDAFSLPGLFDSPGGTLLAAASPGETFTATGRTEAGDWLQVVTSEGKTVWVGAVTVTKANPSDDFMALPIISP